jgi:thiamine biosynthesis lipoprotein
MNHIVDMQRRHILQPDVLAHRAGQIAGSFHEPPAPFDVPIVRASRRAMATLFEVLLPCTLPRASAAVEAALDLIDELEDQLSVFRDHSEVSRLNARAPFERVVVEGRLFDLLERAAHLTRETQGAFDIATGPLIKAWGFYKRHGRVPSVPERAEAMSRTGMRHVVLEREDRMVHYLRPGLEINLGGIGKGYALDRAAELLRDEWNISRCLLHGGASSVVALGTPGGHQRGWPVALKHPWDERGPLGTLWLRDRALGTSAATYQHFDYNGRKLGHLLDPRTGWPAEGTAQVTVLAPTAAEADALSTALFVLGPDAAREYCRTHPEIAAVVLPSGLDARPILFNLEPDSFTLPLPAEEPAGI